MANKHINLKKVEKLAITTFLNALRLHEDSILLFNNKSFPSSYALSVLSLEEHGKVLWIEHFLFHSRCDGRATPKEEEQSFKYIYNHRFKQNEFARHTDGLPHLSKGIMKDLWNGKVEIHKQNAFYVGLTTKNNKFDMQGKILSPTRIDEKKSQNQITVVNDYIVTRMAEYLKGFGCVEIDELGHEFTHERISYYINIWPHMSMAKMQRFKKVMECPDEDLP